MPSQAATIGRFRVRDVLGEGTQGRVYLADDPRLGRQVAIKTLHVDPTQRASMARWLADEARTVSRLSHPNIVTLYDAGDTEGEPYLVLEYVAGQTLDRQLRASGPVPVTRAAEMAIQLLDGIGYAHERGVLHRDLKPGNIIVDGNDLVRIMDFGIALNGVGGQQGGFVGTLLYSAPECVSGGKYLPQSDLYAVAAILYELLTGRTTVGGRSREEVVRSVTQGNIAAPSALNPEVDERLDAIVLRGLARRAEERYATAAEMAGALREYLRPVAAAPASAVGDSTIEFLLRRMRHKADFPALSETMRAINRIAGSEQESASSLAAVILRDFALTNKLLKVVNSAVYGYCGKINTVSRAVVILGFETVRAIAVTLLFLNHLQNKAQAQNMQEELVGTLFTGALARELLGGEAPRERESVFISGIYRSLGRLLALYYFYDEALEIARRVEGEGLSEPEAARAVLGVSYDDLGIAIARTWGFPAPLLASMGRLEAGEVPAPRSAEQRVKVLANLADELREVAARAPLEDKNARLTALAQRYGKALTVRPEQLEAATGAALKAVASDAASVNVSIGQSRLLARVHSWSASAPLADKRARTSEDEQLEFERTVALEETVTGGAEPEAAGAPETVDAEAVLTAGIQDITATLVGEFSLNDLLYMIIETMYRGMGFSRVLLAVRNVRTDVIAGRFGLGSDIETALRAFSFPVAGANDLFAAALRHGRDILITDAGQANVSSRLPDWYRRDFNAPAFALFPVIVEKKPFGLFYADQLEPNRLRLEKKEANLLITLRNQAVLAIRQSVVR